MVAEGINLGFLSIRLYGVVISFTVFLLWFISRRRASRYRISPSIVDDLLLWGTPAVIIGARAYHVVNRWDFYVAHPWQIMAIWQGGLGIWGGLVAGALVFFLYATRKRISLLSLFDLISPPLLLAQGIGRLGNFFNLEGYGPPTTLPWKIFIPLENKVAGFENFSFFHPTFFYEMVWDLGGAMFLFWLAQREKLAKGIVFGYYLLIFSLGRFLTEFWRIDTWQVGEIKVAQLVALIGVLIGGSMLLRSKKSLSS